MTHFVTTMSDRGTLLTQNATRASRTKRSRTRTVVLLTSGFLVAQFLWVLAIPAFMGMDEFDHAFRAASVARGHIAPGSDRVDPKVGRGDLITVPRDIALASGPACEHYTYTLPANCRPTASLGHGQVRIAGAAARYNPAFYLPVGLAARAFHGTTALYAMRVAAALICAGLFGLAVWATVGWARTGWPVAGLFLSATPMTIYSTSVAAPNGAELISGILLWTSLVGWVETPSGELRLRKQLLACAAVASVVLANTHSLGLLWIGLIVIAMALRVGAGRAIETARQAFSEARLAVFVAAVGCAAAGAWTLVAHTNDPRLDPTSNGGHVFPKVLSMPVLWVLQTIAAFPNRNDPAPLIVYAAVGTALVLPFVLGLRRLRGTRHAGTRRAIVFVVCASLVLPLALTIISYHHVGFAWQGRYGMPFSAGALLLCTAVLDRTRAPFPRSIAVGLAAALALADALGQQSVVSKMAKGTWWHSLNWHPPATSLLLVGALVSALLSGSGLVRPGPTQKASR